MYIRLVVASFAFGSAACSSAPQSGEQRAQELVILAQQHLGVRDAKRSDGHAQGPALRDLNETRYESPTVGRFITYYTTPSGEMKLFVVNQPGTKPYAPIKDRVAFIERMMETAVPESSPAERAWGSKQLDSLWRFPSHPLPVQVGDYVFKGMTSGHGDLLHDNLQIIAADTGATGLKYRRQP